MLGERRPARSRRRWGNGSRLPGKPPIFVITPDIGLRDTYLDTICTIGAIGPFAA